MDILIQRDMTTHKGGSSGSPVIDANGYLIGIVSQRTNDGPIGVTVAISTEYLKAILIQNPNLNRSKKDYGLLILETALKEVKRQ